jgi:hypothetical protein
VLREERVLKVFGNTVLRTVFETTREEVTENKRKVLVQIDKIKEHEMGGHVARKGAEKSIQNFGWEA